VEGPGFKLEGYEASPLCSATFMGSLMRSKKFVFPRSGAALFFAVLTAPDLAAADPNCFVPGKNTWQLCQATCMEACKSSKTDVRSAAAICEHLAVMATRKDDPSCPSILAASTAQPGSAVQPSQPSVDACLMKAASGPGPLDRLKEIKFPELEESLKKRLANPPPPSDCAPVPAALSLMYDCIGSEATQIQEGYKSLGDKLRPSANAKQCDRPVSEYGQAARILDGLKKRAAYISDFSEKNLSKCNNRWSDWLDATSKNNNETDSTSVQTEAIVATTMNQLVKDLQEQLKRVVDTQAKVQTTIKSINESLGGVQANVISRLLACN
jgi:hypothetical protein